MRMRLVVEAKSLRWGKGMGVDPHGAVAAGIFVIFESGPP
jgi:hypothetical protein